MLPYLHMNPYSDIGFAVQEDWQRVARERDLLSTLYRQSWWRWFIAGLEVR